MPIIQEIGLPAFDRLADFLSADGPQPIDLSRETLVMELARPDVYVWMGLFTEDSTTIFGAHRGMKLGEYLLLKGIWIARERRGSTATLRLALAMIEHARSTGFAGVAVWIEPSQAERFIAARLRIIGKGPFLHRYHLQVDASTTPDKPLSQQRCGRLDVFSSEAALVKNLLPTDPGIVDWVLDNSRIVLSGNPCASVAELPELVHTIQPLAQSIGATAVEIQLQAADVLSALAIIAPGRRRLSRTPVQLGVLTFADKQAYTSAPVLASLFNP